jgi:hypothetical protein
MTDSTPRNQDLVTQDLMTSVKRSISRSTGIRLLPYFCLGGFVFWSNSNLELSYFLRGYLTLLEAQMGLALLYFFVFKRRRTILVNQDHEK